MFSAHSVRYLILYFQSATGETKEDVYRRIAKVVHPEAYAQDPHTAGSRMKNKNMS